MKEIWKGLRQLYPNAKIDVDYTLEDKSDGKDPYIAYWNPALGTPPTPEQIQAAVTAYDVKETARVSNRRARKQAFLTRLQALGFTAPELAGLRELIEDVGDRDK